MKDNNEYVETVDLTEEQLFIERMMKEEEEND